MNPHSVTLNCPSCNETLRLRTNKVLGSAVRCDYCHRYVGVVRENGNIVALASDSESSEKTRQCLLQHIERYMPLEKWGFKQTSKLFVKHSPGSKGYKVLEKEGYPAIIYRSPKCQVFFTLDSRDHGFGYDAFVYYGRKHAPSDKLIMKWNGRDCYCWHTVEGLTLAFLDDLPPSAANNRSTIWRELANDHEYLNSGTAYIQYPLKLHRTIWNQYGDKLFDLFDVSNPELWSRYTEYVKEYYNIQGWSMDITPNLYSIC